MTRAENRERLIRFLDGIRRPDRRLSEVEDGDDLVRSGLIDSLALLEIVAFLESEFGVDFSGGLDPGRLTTIPRILDFIETAPG